MRATQRFFHRVDHPLPLAMAIAALLGTGGATCADAAVTHPVTSCDDSGPGTLRAIVAAAGNGDVVDFSALQCQQSTISLQSGIVVAQNAYHTVNFFDPKILLSVLMWVVYLVMLYTRWNAGWRGRRAAVMASLAFVAAVVAWAANYFSTIHRFVTS